MSAPAGLSRVGPPRADPPLSDPAAFGAALLPTIDPPYPGWRRPEPGPDGRRSDLIAAIALCAAAVLTLPLYSWAGMGSPSDKAPMWLELLWSGAITLPVAWRRRSPSLVAVIVSAVFVAGGIAFGVALFFHNIALFVAFYTVGAWDPNRGRARWVRIVIAGAMFLWLIISLFVYATGSRADEPAQTGPFSPVVSLVMIQLLTNAVFFAGAYYLGDRGFARALEQDALIRQQQEIARERERSTTQAIMLERVRIARELHDVVAHHVSMMGVQASAARMAIDRDQQLARESLGHVEDSARSAITELRGILTTLRDNDPDPDDQQTTAASDASATIGTRRLPALIDQADAAGLPSRLEVIGTPRQLSATTDVNVYRIVQEALTNARKHAGPRATADVRLRYYDDEVEIEITNSGSTVPFGGPRIGGSGLGQQGMRERVAASGGTIELGPLQRGGYLVRARMPIQSHEADAATS